jgi:hypothetical protein
MATLFHVVLLFSYCCAASAERDVTQFAKASSAIQVASATSHAASRVQATSKVQAASHAAATSKMQVASNATSKLHAAKASWGPEEDEDFDHDLGEDSNMPADNLGDLGNMPDTPPDADPQDLGEGTGMTDGQRHFDGSGEHLGEDAPMSGDSFSNSPDSSPGGNPILHQMGAGAEIPDSSPGDSFSNSPDFSPGENSDSSAILNQMGMGAPIPGAGDLGTGGEIPNSSPEAQHDTDSTDGMAPPRADTDHWDEHEENRSPEDPEHGDWLEPPADETPERRETSQDGLKLFREDDDVPDAEIGAGEPTQFDGTFYKDLKRVVANVHKQVNNAGRSVSEIKTGASDLLHHSKKYHNEIQHLNSTLSRFQVGVQNFRSVTAKVHQEATERLKAHVLDGLQAGLQVYGDS